MNDVLEKSLYKRNCVRFKALSIKAKEFNGAFNGNNILQDDIFRVMENYARHHEVKLDTMFLPIQDDDFCAFTCIRKGKIFVVINSWLPLAKQIFAAAHELYHIWCYFHETNNSLLKEGSLLTAESIEMGIGREEEMEANAFSALLLVPAASLSEQVEIYGINRKNIGMGDVLALMDIFAVPYKAMILRLHEEGYLSERKAQEFLDVPVGDVMKYILLFNKAVRWQRRTPEIVSAGRLQGLINSNVEMEILPESRISEDRERLAQIMKEFEWKWSVP